MLNPFAHRPLPEGLEGLSELALDLRWTWSEANTKLWELLDPETWERTKNPYMILQNVSQARLEEAARDEQLKQELQVWLERRRRALEDPGWFGRAYPQSPLKNVAYFSMEFGLTEALPIYSGGLGVLAGDHLKTASDLGVPVLGIGLLYQQGYFRQTITADQGQLEAFPYNDPTSLPVTPVQDQAGGWLRIKLEMPGRTIFLKVWQAQVGKVKLYLLDSNDPLNRPWDRGITANLYAYGQERRLIQEIVLALGGWRALESLGIEIDVCHLNEGHAAFVVFARAVSFMRKTGQPFPVALWATRAGNVFTTHTAVAAGFDRFESSLLKQYVLNLADAVGVPIEDIFAMGRQNPYDQNEPFNMAYLAIRGSCCVNGVSRLHGKVSRRMFQVLYPGWPQSEVPVGHVTNGVHVPSWDSPRSHSLWSSVCGDTHWLGLESEECPAIENVSDSELWNFRAASRLGLIEYVRRRLVRQVKEQSATAEIIERARHVLNPNALTLGFARRFATYKRPTLLMHDPDRLARLLRNSERPVQLIVAGKAHPRDDAAKAMVQQLARFAARPELFDSVVFLEDYDMVLAHQLIAGIDVWINTPRRPWEASGTSGMKVLVNGGLNLSELDGWWAEAYTPEVGWALGDGKEHEGVEWDAFEAEQLYDILETQVVPRFYERNQQGIPEKWIHCMRASMSSLTPQFSSNRMMREYVERAYLPAAALYNRRSGDGGRLAVELLHWQKKLAEHWKGLRFGDIRVTHEDDRWHFEAQVYLGDLDPDMVCVELYADPLDEEEPIRVIMNREGEIPGAVHGYLFSAVTAATRPSEHFTARIVPNHSDAYVPLEENHIFWQR